MKKINKSPKFSFGYLQFGSSKHIVFLLLLVLSFIGCSSTSFTTAQNQSSPNIQNQAQDLIYKKLIGQWQGTYSGSSGEKVLFVFTPDKKSYIVMLRSKETILANFKLLDVSKSPKQIDLVSGEVTLQGIFELEDEKRLRIQLPQLFDVDNSRVTQFDKESLLLQKISDSPLLSTETTIYQLTREMVQRRKDFIQEANAQFIIGSMNSAQRGFLFSNGHFASNLVALGSLCSGSGCEFLKENENHKESENYIYKIIYLESSYVYQVAIPKRDGLRSFAGIVYRNSSSSEAAICKSFQPSRTPPSIPNLVGGKVECPDRSRRF